MKLYKNDEELINKNKMSIIRITKEFYFEMAHALFGYDGPCKNIHGHSYQLSVTVKGKPIITQGNSKQGMIMDFTDLKSAVYLNTYIPKTLCTEISNPKIL